MFLRSIVSSPAAVTRSGGSAALARLRPKPRKRGTPPVPDDSVSPCLRGEPPLSPQPLVQVILQLGDLDALLCHRVAVADGDGVLVGRVLLPQGVEIDRNAERRPDL